MSECLICKKEEAKFSHYERNEICGRCSKLQYLSLPEVSKILGFAHCTGIRHVKSKCYARVPMHDGAIRTTKLWESETIRNFTGKEFDYNSIKENRGGNRKKNGMETLEPDRVKLYEVAFLLFNKRITH